MARKQRKKTNQKWGKKENCMISSLVGVICLLLIFSGALKLDKDGNFHYIGFGNEAKDEIRTEYESDWLETDSVFHPINKYQTENSGETKVQDIELPQEGLGVYFLNVGQADCIFVYEDGACMLIDAGNNPDGKLISQYLKSHGITKIDYLIGTHPDEDHIGGLDVIIEDFSIGNMYMPKKASTTKTYEDVLDAILAKKMKVKSPKVGSKFSLGNATCEIMSIENDAEDSNEASICIELTYGSQKFLFTGDMESANEEARKWNKINVLKVAHHGSSTSSTEEFLEQTSPEIAVISCGKDNKYGHPHKETLEKLEKIGCEVYRTDEMGTIVITSDGTKETTTFLDVCLDGNVS